MVRNLDMELWTAPVLRRWKADGRLEPQQDSSLPGRKSEVLSWMVAAVSFSGSLKDGEF